MNILEALKRFTEWLIAVCIVWALIGYALSATPFLKDSTDVSGWFQPRSGMTPLVDTLTGCEYLGSKGGITPRLLPNGQQICTKKESF